MARTINTLAVERMSSEQLWNRVRADLYCIHSGTDCHRLHGHRYHWERVWLCIAELRLRGIQGKLEL